MRAVTLVALLAAAAVVCGAPQAVPAHPWALGDFNTQVMGLSGTLTVARPIRPVDPHALVMTFGAITEVDANGTVLLSPDGMIQHGHGDFSVTQFTFTSPVNASVQDIPATKFMYYAPLQVTGAKLLVDVAMFKSEGWIGLGAECYDVRRGMLKMALQITEWPFCGARDGEANPCPHLEQEGRFVDVDLTVQTRRFPQVDPYSHAPGPNGQKIATRLDVGDAYLNLPTDVLVDGEWVTMPMGYPKIQSQDGSSTTISLRLPRGRAIEYSPALEYGFVPNSALTMSAPWALLMALVLAVAVHLSLA